LASETQPKDLCFRAVRCREAVGVQVFRFISLCVSVVVIFEIFSGSDAGGRFSKSDVASDVADDVSSDVADDVSSDVSSKVDLV
jgi:hypothetical protein